MIYSVWVGGCFDVFKTKEQAEERAEYWREQGYDDVEIEEEEAECTD